MNCRIKMIWDFESETWYTSSQDVPGLVLSAPNCDALIQRVKDAAPEMLELNCDYIGPVNYIFEMVRVDSVVA